MCYTDCIVGGYNHEDGSYSDDIMEWDGEEKTWTLIGNMKMERALHAMSTIKIEGEIVEYCG